VGFLVNDYNSHITFIRGQSPVYDYELQANECILLDNYATILSINTSETVTAYFSGSTNTAIQGAFVMYIDENLPNMGGFKYVPSGDSVSFIPGVFHNQGYKFCPFLVDWETLVGNTGSIEVDLSTGQSVTLNADQAILLDNLTQFPILGGFQDGVTYRAEIDGNPYMPQLSVFVMYVDNGEYKFEEIPLGGTLIFTPGTGDYKFCAFQVDWSNIASNTGATSVTIFEEAIIPVELTAFTASIFSGNVTLNWTTSTETNNSGFEVQRMLENTDWERIGFVGGHGTTTEKQSYQYIDEITDLQVTSLSYRLKLIDYDGSYEYSEEVLVDNPAPVHFALHQNHPNPFNPTTTVSYSIPKEGLVTLKVYNAIGEEVAVLVNEVKQADNYNVMFNASSLASGIYVYQLKVNSIIETKKMVLMK
jgi:hypothetical protein